MKHRITCKCRCCFVPPIVAESLARNGVEQARISLTQSQQFRTDRSSRVMNMPQFAGLIPTGTASREVYNSQNKWEQRVPPPVRKEGDPVTGDQDTGLAYDYAGIVRDYFKNVLNRNSIDNLGLDIILNVHYGVNYMNAFWDGEQMTFGDGDGRIFTSFAKSLDVVAHELAHGVTEYTANLVYRSQSGALNEHFSDVFGTAITQYHLGQSAGEADWLIGDEIMGPELYGEALRSMREPGTAYDNSLLGKDPQPAHMKDYFTGPEDNQGVHTNSGIPNKAFYLTAMELGTDKATLIWYTALQKLWITANFNDAVQVIVESARLLVKDNQVPRGATQIVRSAFKSVGLPS